MSDCSTKAKYRDYNSAFDDLIHINKNKSIKSIKVPKRAYLCNCGFYHITSSQINNDEKTILSLRKKIDELTGKLNEITNRLNICNKLPRSEKMEVYHNSLMQEYRSQISTQKKKIDMLKIEKSDLINKVMTLQQPTP